MNIQSDQGVTWANLRKSQLTAFIPLQCDTAVTVHSLDHSESFGWKKSLPKNDRLELLPKVRSCTWNLLWLQCHLVVILDRNALENWHFYC